METKLNEYLREGESIRWQGQPVNFPLMDNGSKMQILRKWALTVIIAAGALIAHMQSQMPPRMGLVAVVVACALVIALTPVAEKSSLMKNRSWITNQRLIHMTKDGVFYYMDLADVDRYEIVTDLSDQETLVLGSAIFDDAKKYVRWRANHPMEDPDSAKSRDHVDGMIFYNVGSTAAAAAAVLKDLGCRRAA